jgi:DNA (cytosine-5)-methyltransferase 1
MAGKRQPNDPRNSLFMEYLRIVKDIRPKVFLMENVKGLLSMKNESGIKVIDIILEEFGKLKEYDVELHQVNAANYGVPQRRQRIFIIGVKKGIDFSFPLPTHSKNDSKLKEWIGVGEVILDKNKVPEKYFYSDKLIRGFKRRAITNKKKGVGFGWQINKPNVPSYTISARYWKDGAESLIKYDEETIRMLTPEECALVQSFPKSYVFKGNEQEIYTQIGNAVPPLMAKSIAKSIKTAISP